MHIFYYTVPLLKSIISTTTRYNVEIIPRLELRHLFYYIAGVVKSKEIRHNTEITKVIKEKVKI